MQAATHGLMIVFGCLLQTPRQLLLTVRSNISLYIQLESYFISDHETNSSTPHWSPAIRMNPDYAPRVQQQQEEARLNHEGTADSALVTGNRSRSGSSVSSHSSVRYASMRSSTSPVSAAPLDRQQFSDECKFLSLAYVCGHVHFQDLEICTNFYA